MPNNKKTSKSVPEEKKEQIIIKKENKDIDDKVQDEINQIIDLYFKQPRILYEHLFTSYNQLVEEIIPYCLIQEPNHFYQNVIENNIYMHGFKCSNIRIKPPTFDNDNEIKFPSDARKNHLNYFATVVGDVVQILEKVDILTGEKTIKEIGEPEKELAIGNIPVMIKSKYCSTQIKKDLHGECKYDPGGYFIVSGQEKVVMSIEKMVDNKSLVFTKKEPTFPDGLVYIIQINSRKNDWADNLQIITIKNRKDNDLTITTSSLVDVPLFVLFRALGVESDQDIISKITYDLNDVKMINLLRSSMEYATDDLGNNIKTREEAIEYLATKLRKNKMISQSDEKLAKIQRKMMLEKILRQDFLPHLGEDIPKKICYLGYMVNKLLNVWLGRTDPDDRDALQNKRIETPGILIGQLFRQNWKKMLNEIGKLFAKKNQSDESPINVLNQIKPAIIEQGIKTALATGIWGMNKTKKGVAQSLQRLSWVQAISYLRRVMAPSLDSSTSKVTSIRQGQNLQVQFLCLTGESEVLTNNGLKKIREFDGSEIVKTINKDTLETEESEIYNLFNKESDSLYKLETTNGFSIKATGDHPFLKFNEISNSNEWVQLINLKINDTIYGYENNKTIKILVRSITNIPNELVYDFTTKSSNHSFIASSIVVSNCIAETPEGQKIGIVKSLAMMASVAHQNSSQYEIVKAVLRSTKMKHPADIDPLQMKNHTKIFMNGDWLGVCKLTETNDVYKLLKDKRKGGVIDKYTTISLDYNKREIKVYFDGGRLIRPIMIVEDNKLGITKDVMEDVNKELQSKENAKGWKKLLSKYDNLVEYEDIESSNYIMCAERHYKLNEAEENREKKIEYTDASKINRYGEYRWIKYTHCDFHSWTQLGIIAGNIPFSNHNHSGRNIIHFSQAKQAISVYLTSYKDRMDISQILYYPQLPIVTTKTMEYNNCLDLPYGENCVLAVMSYNGYNQEDSMVFNQSAIDRGLLRADTLKKYHSEIDKNPSTNQDDIFTKPDKNKVADMKQGNYSKLNDKGFAPEETELQNEDFIIGKVSPIQPTGDNNKIYKDSSEIFKSNVDGVIDRVHTGVYNAEGYEMYNVRVRMERIPVIGDKFCLTPEHEVLTTSGWKTIDKVTLNDSVACLNTFEEIYYSKPSKLWEFNHKGKMYKLESQQIDLTTTLEHKMYIKKRDHRNYELVEAKDIMGKRVNYKKNGKWIKPEQEIFKIGELNLPMNDWLYFLGIWYAEGWVEKSENKRITISANKQRVKTKLEEVCKNLDIHIIKSKDDKWHMHKIGIYNYLLPLSVGAVNKELPEWVFDLSESQSKILLEGLMLGDGYINKSNAHKYFTSSKKLADNVTRLALHCGWSANMYEREMKEVVLKDGTVIKPTAQPYELCIIKTKNEPTINHGHCKTQNGQSENIIDYDGKVYCIEVPNHVFYTRLNMKPCWTGYSNRHG